MNLKNALALITGASSGIGAALAHELAQHGARVALVARSATPLHTLATALGGQAYPTDLSDPAQVDTLAEQVQAKQGTPDLILNSAGAGRWLYTEETSPTEARAQMDAPYFAAFYTTRAFLPAMLARGSGWVVNINSPAARFPWPGATGYTAARWALQGFTEALRLDLRGTGLRVLSVVCSKVDTPYFTTNPGTLERAPWLAEKLIPTLSPQAVARATVRGLRTHAREVILPWQLHAFYLLHQVAPWLVEALIAYSGHRHPHARLP